MANDHRRTAPLLGALAITTATLGTAPAQAATEPTEMLERGRRDAPAPPWPSGDERGMANAIGAQTWARCGWHLSQPGAREFEISHLRTSTMPKSPFSPPYAQKFQPTASLPGTRHAFNSEHYEAGAEPASQATQIDALGHFGALPRAWDGKGDPPVDEARYYGGFTQKDVKPAPDSPLRRLGVERIPPLVTSAVLLDARAAVGGGEAMKAGELVSAKDLEAMLERQGLAARGVLPGDIVLVYTGWSDHWKDPAGDTPYYTAAPGLGLDAAKWLAERRIAAVGLDVPFIDPAPTGMLAGKAAPAPGTPEGLPFAVHHHLLIEAGIHHLENANLAEAAQARLWTSCAIVLPLRTQGAAGSPVRPVLIGVPQDRQRR